MERPISDIKTLGDWIRARRIAKNHAPYHLAHKMGIAHSVIRSRETGVSQPESNQLIQLSEILELRRGLSQKTHSASGLCPLLANH
ncbi:MAG TPA: hypothetical protein VGO57_02120 [Verrucomicrobiae bacterium]